MSRAGVFGPGSLHSLTRFGQLSRDVGVSARLKDAFRLERQRHIRNDTQRERIYRLCTRCGITTVTINFDAVPSARIGLWGRCVNNSDYTHHRFAELSQREYEKLREQTPEHRLQWWNYEERQP